MAPVSFFQPITVEVYEGVESVLLPCKVFMISEDPVVVWSRFDLNPTTIHLHQDKDEFYVQNQCYSSRTSMSADARLTGDFSLILNKPRLSDSGNYTCSVRMGRYEVRRTDVHLQVKEPYTFPAEARVLLVLLAVALVALGLAVYLQYKTVKLSQVEVKEGVWFVELPYKTKVQLPEDVTVEWSRCAPEPMKVHVYHNVSNHLVKQDKIYRGRTNMKTEPLKSGDLTLTLRDPSYRDSGTYICTVHKEREILAQKVVRLRVTVLQEVVEVGEWVESVTLPFITTAQLPEDATVEWRHTEPKAMMVHVYQNGQDQPGKQDEYYHGRTKMNNDPLQSKDLSVSFQNSGYRDRGTYICTVRRDGYVLAKKVVLHRIKVSSVNVEVDEMAMVAKLPWQITANLPEDATVEWSCWSITLHHLTTVHVFQNGQDQSDKQGEFYRGRTMMKKNPLQTGDLSLTLTDPTDRDNGSYLCTVRVSGEVAWEKIVSFKVKERR
ncbi:butyrophilin-like protein 2 [Enoplosus armatus]|uniref:butyrophilin-like protein 2 n=1 Tax=Enoplosus armatus TaxID=215367 RepID=UPI0039945178